MIQSVRLKNFRCHRVLEIELSPTITTLVGPTDAGKSSVLAGIRWLVFNRPLGDDFVQHTKESASVRLVVDNRSIRRSKGKGKNAYVVDSQQFVAFGQGVPTEVGQLLQLGEVNFQRQHDPPFWLSLSPGDLSRALNSVIALDKIDSTLANVALEKKRAVTQLDVAEQKLADTQGVLEGLDWVDEAEERLARLEEREKRLHALETHRNELQAIVDQLATYLPLANEVVPTKRLDDLMGRCYDIQKREKQRDELQVIVNRLEEAEASKCRSNTQLVALQAEYRKKTEGRECPLCLTLIKSP